jgi:cell division protein ZapA (FtsZ GTPase activity inhibitor)
MIPFEMIDSKHLQETPGNCLQAANYVINEHGLTGELTENSQILLARLVGMLVAINLLMTKQELAELDKTIYEITKLAVAFEGVPSINCDDDEDLCASGHTV